MRKTLVITFLIIVFFMQLPPILGSNPFFSPSKSKVIAIPTPVIIKKCLQNIFQTQQYYINRLSQLTRNMKQNPSPRNFWLLMNLAFFYGVIHALGPGHGKTLTFSYCMSSASRNLKTGLLLGVFISILQSVSAIIIVLIVNYIIKQPFVSTFDNMSYWISIGSYLLIILIGIWLLFGKIISLTKSGSALASTNNFFTDSHRMLSIAFSIGIIPCPAATLILLFALSLNILHIGILLVTWMTLGVAVTIALIGIVTILTKQGVIRLIGQKDLLISRIKTGVELLGSLLITLFGIILLLSAI